MAKGYWIVELDIFDAERYRAYVEVVVPFLDRVGGRTLIRAPIERVEGEGKPRMVVVEFDTYALAREVYFSAEYRVMVGLRQAGARADFAIVEGSDA